MLILLLATQAIGGTLQDWGDPGSLEWGHNCYDAFMDQGGPPTLEELESCDPATETCLYKASTNVAAFPKAVCADGGPAAFYYRPGEGSGLHKWVIQLQGGVRPASDLNVLERWCGLDDQYGSGSLTMRYAPNEAAAGGIHSPDATNPFANWNHVFAVNCHTDRWLGRRDERILDATFPEDGIPHATPPSVTIAERGHTILRTFRKMLVQDNGGTAWFPTPFAEWPPCPPPDVDPDPSDCVPNLEHAEEILFAGSSSGGFGAIRSADWFLQPFSNAKVALLVDAAAGVSSEVLDDQDWTWDGQPLSQVLEDAEAATQPSLDDINAFVDDDCVSTADCNTSDSMLLPWEDEQGISQPARLATPTFVRFDLLDNLVHKAFTPDSRLEIAGQPATENDVRAMVRASLIGAHEDAHAPGDVPVMGVFGPACEKHVGINHDDVFFDHETGHFPLVSGDPVTNLSTSAWDWFQSGLVGFQSIKRVDNGNPYPSRSVCP